MSIPTKAELLDTIAEFIWFFGQDWFVETPLGNFHWRDPDYGNGDNTMIPFSGDYKAFCRKIGVQFGRDKGSRSIRAHCGEDFTLIVAAEL